MLTDILHELTGRANRCLHAVSLVALACAANSTLAGCACSDATDEIFGSGGNGPRVDGAGGVPPGGTGGATGNAGASAGGTNAGGTNAGGTNAAGTSAGGTNAGGTDAGGTSAGGTNTGGSGGQEAGLPDAAPTPDSGPKEDCTPSGWKDPGTVVSPEVVAVAADAGQKGQMWGLSKGIDKYDYLEEEFFFKGTSPAYTSRMVVHRPKDPAKFTGTVFMEWYNVTGGIDIAPLWAVSREYLMREGHVHVGVSAQAVGANALKNYDAGRYAAINHPGDTAANAIFSQAAKAIRTQGEKLLGRCMPVDAVVALGQSQSSAMLATYLNSAHPTARIYDGFMLHSAPFGSPPSAPNVPVFVVFTMNEANGSVIDQPNIVEWEVAGASHNDAHLTARGNEEQGSQLDGGVGLRCTSPLNNFPSFWVYNAALDWLNRWVRKGERPPRGAPMQTAQVDQYGNVRGGVRIQDIEVPIAKYTSSNSAANPLDILSSLGCGLGGSVVPLTPQQLLQLYPTHDDYVGKYTRAADKAVADGFLLPADHQIAIQQAKSAPIPN